MRPDIVFYQSYAFEYFGVMCLHSKLTHEGYKTALIIDQFEKHPIERLKQLNPRLIGISAMSMEHDWMVKLIYTIKKELPDIPIIVGGIHGIVYYEDILRSAPADLVCHSEGEEVLTEVMRELDRGTKNWGSIPGLAYRERDGSIKVNERARLVELNDQVIEDRSIYYDTYPRMVSRYPGTCFFSSRGCPYRCSFCYNAVIHDIFKDHGKYLRQKSVDNFIIEIKTAVEKYHLKKIFFFDDLFTFNKSWLLDFLDRYKREITLPFICFSRANLMTDEVAAALAKAGCYSVSFGIETGNEELRRKLLNKQISDDEIRACGRALARHGIKVHASNMFCLPKETIPDALRTVELNHEAQVKISANNLFMPFPKTDLAEYCIGEGFLPKDYSLKDMQGSYQRLSVVQIPNKYVIKNIHALAFFFIRWPLSYKIFRFVIYSRLLSWFSPAIYNIGDVFHHMEQKRTSLWETFKLYTELVFLRFRLARFNRTRQQNMPLKSDKN